MNRSTRAHAVAALFLTGFIGLAVFPGMLEAGEEPARQFFLCIRSLRKGVKAGDPIPMEFAITNTGKAACTYMDRNYDRSGRMPEYELHATDAGGRAVPDPRASWPGGPGGGLSTDATLAPGASFTKTIDLNRWALVTKPGRYEVVGVYHPHAFRQPGVSAVRSHPITITVEPRSDAEMNALVLSLSTQLATAKGEQRKELVRRLMYTRDARIVPALVESMYAEGDGFWQAEAFIYYLPRSEKVTEALYGAALARGMTTSMPYIFNRWGLEAEKMRPLVAASLASDRPPAWAAGALLAHQFPDDRLVPRLIQLATDKASGAWEQAIFALALHRTDEGVATLKRLLASPDQRVRDRARSAVRVAYTSRGNAGGRPLESADFPEDLQRPKSE